MSELPKIARARLQSAGPQGLHPDANLMSAFLENSLTGSERAQVLGHLACCADCRAVAGLALPEVAVAPVTAPKPERTWLTWTVLRWGTLAASAVIIAVAVLVLRPDQTAQRKYVPAVAPAAETRAPAAEAKQAEHEAAPPAKSEVAAQRRDQVLRKAAPPSATNGFVAGVTPKLAEQPAAKPVPMQPPAAQQQVITGPTAAQKQQYLAQQKDAILGSREPQKAAAEPVPPPVATANAVTAERNVAVPMVPANVANVQPQQAPARVPQATQTVEVAAEAKPVETAKSRAVPARPGEALQMRAAPATGATRGRLLKKELDVRWTIGESGTVIRSDDGGQTWNEVPVAKGVAFRALSAAGNDVWAGGAGGALFHSSDAGAHWTRVRPTSQGTALTSDLVRIEFTDAQHGTLTTTAGEQWVTSDGGQTWSVVSR